MLQKSLLLLFIISFLSLFISRTSRVQSTVPGSRAEPVTATSVTTPVKAESSGDKPVQVTDVKEEPAVAQEQKIQLSDLQSILGNLQPGSSAQGRAG